MIFDGNYAAAGALTGFIVGLTGVGGGALMTPLLLLVFGVAPTTAVATDLWFAAITKLVGAHVHMRSGQVDWQVVKRLWAGSLPVALLVVIAVSVGGSPARAGWLTSAIGAVVLLTAIGLLVAPRLMAMARSRRLGNADGFHRMQPALTVAAGAALGVLVALTSVGAGALGSVMLLYLYPLRMTPHKLVATDLVHAIPLAFIAGIGYLVAGLVDWHMLASLLAGSVPAILVGSLLARRLPARTLQVSLATVLIFVGAKALV